MWLREVKDGVIISVRVVPRASSNRVEGALGDALKIRLTAPPVDGKANKELVRFLADLLGLSASSIRLVGGERGRRKEILLAGVDAATARKALET